MLKSYDQGQDQSFNPEGQDQDLGHRSWGMQQLRYAAQYVWQPDTITIGNKLNFDCICLDIHLLLITYRVLLFFYYN